MRSFLSFSKMADTLHSQANISSFFIEVKAGLKHPLVIRGIGLLSGGISLELTHIYARGRQICYPFRGSKQGLVVVMINGGYHGNGDSAGTNMDIFVHLPGQHMSTQ